MVNRVDYFVQRTIIFSGSKRKIFTLSESYLNGQSFRSVMCFTFVARPANRVTVVYSLFLIITTPHGAWIARSF